MELRQLRYFLALSSCRSMTLAARKLFITQQALSKAVISLEEELGVPLFVRGSRGLELTPCGRTLLPMAKKTVRDADLLLSAAGEMRNSINSVVRLGYVVGSFNEQSALPFSVVSRYEQQNPNVSVYIVEHDEAELVQMVLDEELDFAYIVDQGQRRWGELIYHEIARENICVLCSVSNPLSHKKMLSLEDFRSETVLIGKIDPIPEEIAALSSAFRKQDFQPSVKYINGASRQCVEHVRINEGIIFAGQAYLKGLNLSGLMIREFPDKSIFSRHLLICKKDRKMTLSARKAFRYFKENARVL